MNWLEIVLILSLILGLISGGILIARSPVFWFGLGSAMFKALLPHLLKRMPPEEEEAWRRCQRKGGKWNYIKRRCE
jgi:hypothetical protein